MKGCIFIYMVFQSAKKSPLANTGSLSLYQDDEGLNYIMFQSAKKSPLANTKGLSYTVGAYMIMVSVSIG